MKDQVIISFPGLGIGDFTVSKVAFSIDKLSIVWFIAALVLSAAITAAYIFYQIKKKGKKFSKDELFSIALIPAVIDIIVLLLCFISISVRWYGLIICVGMVTAFCYTLWRAKQAKVSVDDCLDIGLFTILFGVLGARLYWVIFYGNIHSFYDIIAVWDGGLAIYGGIICGTLAILGVCRYKKMNFLAFADMVGPGVMIAQAIGRWGNFFNGEAYGGVVAEGSALYFLRMGLYPNNISGVLGMAYVHPTFLYESLWNILGFVLINLFYKKKKFNGEIALWYFAWYGFGRMLIEGLRTDSLMLGSLRVSQVVGLLCAVGGAALVIFGRVYYYRKEKAAAAVSAETEQPNETKETENGENH